MTEFIDYTPYSHSSLSTVIYNSSFNGNNANNYGAGACLHHSKVYLDLGVEVIIKFIDTQFKENNNRGTFEHRQGGGISVEFYLSQMFTTSVKITVDNCHFISNNGQFGAGISTLVESCDVKYDSLIIFMVADSIFSKNTAEFGAGIFTKLDSCTVDPLSSFMLETNYSTFSVNKAERGAGIYTRVDACHIENHSSVMLKTTGSTFNFNSAMWGAGIYSGFFSSHVKSTSVLILQTVRSDFSFNTAETGAGIHIKVRNSPVRSNSFIKECWALLINKCP